MKGSTYLTAWRLKPSVYLQNTYSLGSSTASFHPFPTTVPQPWPGRTTCRVILQEALWHRRESSESALCTSQSLQGAGGEVHSNCSRHPEPPVSRSRSHCPSERSPAVVWPLLKSCQILLLPPDWTEVLLQESWLPGPFHCSMWLQQSLREYLLQQPCLCWPNVLHQHQ